MGHGAPGEPGADVAPHTNMGTALDEIARLEREKTALLAALRATQDIIHLHFCQAGDKSGNKECWKECQDAQTAIKAAS